VGRSFFRDLRRAPGALIALGLIAAFLILMIIGPIIWSASAAHFDVFASNQGPTRKHWLGTDSLGHDLLRRLLVATRLSIGLALLATAVSAGIGFALGAGAALLPARIRPVGLRLIDTMLAFPAILVAIFVGVIVGRGAYGATLGVGIAGSFYIARVTSSLALSVASREYVLAARVLGVRRHAVLFRYVLPNIADTLAIVITVAISNAIVFLAALSFLGLGVQQPQYDWGQMLTLGVQQFYLTPVAALAPAAFLALSAICFGFAGEALARVLNPQLATAGGSSRRSAVKAAFAGARLPPPPAVAAPLEQPALEVSQLTVQIPGKDGPLDIVTDISFVVAKGETVGIVGESGSGKSTIANAIAQLVPYPGVVSGSVKLEGKDIAKLGRAELDQLLGTDVAVVFQDPMSALNPALRVGIQLTERAEVHRGMRRKQARSLAVDRLTEVRIPAAERQLDRYSLELSGGMRQRVVIAMGLMNEPGLLIADEPTTALDVTIQAQIMDLLRAINGTHHTAIVLISHDLSLISQSCSRLLVTYAGRIVEELPTSKLADPRHPYTRALLDAVPDVNRPRDLELAAIPGQAPDIASRPSGCPYHPRCPLAVDRCREQNPPLLARGADERVACWVANESVADESA
jgi:oligopeptide/dipeptide ABC transporter ATP-binding protein